ncbi:MAG TPA: hypothetical protein VJH20_02970 [Candidatus Nanoarchaeia archaeon]|nr:hypothetical protein [Candidatus Nanoarchaeia archaeon]
MKKKKIDLIILLLYPAFASLISIIFEVNTFFSILVFFGIPSLFLSLKLRKYILKNIYVSAIAGIFFLPIIDYIAHITKTWFIPSMFDFRILGQISIEFFLFATLNVYFVVAFYQYFLEEHLISKSNKNMKYLVFIIVGLLILFPLLFVFNPIYLQIPYFYLIFGAISILIPIILVLLKFPILYAKFFKAAAYFFFLSITYEITALKLGLWEFPGNQFIGWVEIFGVRFPFEELFFWIILGAMAVLSYYEFFDDDRK